MRDGRVQKIKLVAMTTAIIIRTVITNANCVFGFFFFLYFTFFYTFIFNAKNKI
jgi:hypothetical protein